MNINNVLFVYSKGEGNEKKIKVLDMNDAAEFEDSPEWEHIGTINPSSYIRYILENNEAIYLQMKGNPR